MVLQRLKRLLQQVTWFQLAEGDCPSLAPPPRHGASVGGDSGGKVNGDGRDALGLRVLHQAGDSVGQPGPPADAEDPGSMTRSYAIGLVT